jgi:hypothetical protein
VNGADADATGRWVSRFLGWDSASFGHSFAKRNAHEQAQRPEALRAMRDVMSWTTSAPA